jgi:hypothetical protein
MKLIQVLAPIVPALYLLAAGCACPCKSKSTVLFDGTSTEHLRAFKSDLFPDKSWKVENGALHTLAGAPSVDVVSREEYEDFDLTFEWKVVAGANSGVMYRVTEEHDAPYETGPEYQVLDDAKHADGKDPRTSAAALYALMACNSQKALKPVGEWNQARILVQHGHVEHWLNGKMVLTYEWASPEVNALIAKSKFATMPGFMTKSRGHIDFQHHGDEVWYRNIKVRTL